MKSIQILNRINSYAEYEKKMKDYTDHIMFMIGKKDKPIPLHVMIVSGDKGVGKTYTAEQILKNQDVRPCVTVNTSLTAIKLYKLMWDNPDAIIVIDDVNAILQDAKDGASLLKACTETRHVRRLQWQKQNADCIPVSKLGLTSNEAILNKMTELSKITPRLEKAHLAGKTFPDTFFFTGALIILTNKPLNVIDRITEGAVSNRGWHQEMLFTVDGAVDLLKHSADKMKTFNDIEIEHANLEKALKFLTSADAILYYKNNGKLPTLRTLGKVALECEYGNEPDMDMLINNTESPAY